MVCTVTYQFNLNNCDIKLIAEQEPQYNWSSRDYKGLMVGFNNL